MITKAEQLVTSLEISQKFQELDVPQGQSYFVWIEKSYADPKEIFVCPRKFIRQNVEKILCDAFTLSELYFFDDISRNIPAKIKTVNEVIQYIGSNIIRRIKRGITDVKDLKL
jgi:hypothetical protein